MLKVVLIFMSMLMVSCSSLVKDEILGSYGALSRFEGKLVPLLEGKKPSEVKKILGIPFFSGYREGKDMYYMAYPRNKMNRRETVGFPKQPKFTCIIMQFWDSNDFRWSSFAGYEAGTVVETKMSCAQRVGVLMKSFGARFSYPEVDFKE